MGHCKSSCEELEMQRRVAVRMHEKQRTHCELTDRVEAMCGPSCLDSISNIVRF